MPVVARDARVPALPVAPCSDLGGEASAPLGRSLRPQAEQKDGIAGRSGTDVPGVSVHRAPDGASVVVTIVCVAGLLAGCSSSSSSGYDHHRCDRATQPLAVTWVPSYAAPGTPARYNKVGILKIGPSSAKNVLVLEPGTSAGSAYFVPLAKWIVANASGWQVWSVERRQNLLEDQSEVDLAKEGKATAAQLFDYYLGYLKDPGITHHFHTIPNSTVSFASQWGMKVAVQDLHVVIDAAKKLGGKVVLGGHSLGGSVVTAYATWDFDGRAGADRPCRPGLHRRRQQPTPRKRGGRHPGSSRPSGARRITLAGLRWDHRPLRRAVQLHRGNLSPSSIRAFPRWARPRASSRPTSSPRCG